MAPAGHQRPFAFGDWQVDPSRGLLTGADGESVRLEPRLMDLLLLFAGSGGRVLGKDEIAAATWGDRAIGDDTLAAAVSRLRRALGGAREQLYIETVPQRGYGAVVESPPHGYDARAAYDGPPEATTLVAQDGEARGFAAGQGKPSSSAALLRGGDGQGPWVVPRPPGLRRSPHRTPLHGTGRRPRGGEGRGPRRRRPGRYLGRRLGDPGQGAAARGPRFRRRRNRLTARDRHRPSVRDRAPPPG